VWTISYPRRSTPYQDVAFYTRLMAFSGAGAVAGALVVAWPSKNKRMGYMTLISRALFGTMMVGFALSRTSYVSALILFTAGSLLVMCLSLATSLAQLLAPPAPRTSRLYLLGGVPWAAHRSVVVRAEDWSRWLAPRR
jgi:hypothetical protein